MLLWASKAGTAESEEQTLSEESIHGDLEQLTEQTAEQTISTLGAATSDPQAAVMRLLRQYLEQAQEQAYDDALHGQQLEERDHRN